MNASDKTRKLVEALQALYAIACRYDSTPVPMHVGYGIVQLKKALEDTGLYQFLADIQGLGPVSTEICERVLRHLFAGNEEAAQAELDKLR